MSWRVTELRRLLAMPAANDRTLSIDRIGDFRNGLEHIDQRIDIAVRNPEVHSLSDWYLTDGMFLTSPEDQPLQARRAGLRGFYPEGGLALFDRTPVDLFELDLDMLRVRHNSREAQAELCAEVQGRSQFGGGQIRDYTPRDLAARRDWWATTREEIIAGMAPTPPLAGRVLLWLQMSGDAV